MAKADIYQNIPSEWLCKITNSFSDLGFNYQKSLMRGALFTRSDSQAVMLDYGITDAKFPFRYSEYTEEQNALMHHYKSLYRLIVDSEEDLIEAARSLEMFINKSYEESEQKVQSHGINRHKESIDPTAPEAYFEKAFLDVYGHNMFDHILREVPIIDVCGETKYIDYYIERDDYNVAIEKNGEKYHHPIIVGMERYKSQLLKQNSLVAYGDKVFRWALSSMMFDDKFHEDIKQYIGEPQHFLRSHKVVVNRNFKLYDHQKDALDTIRQSRKNGIDCALVVLPTGTGKSEILVSEIAELQGKRNSSKVLIAAPSSKLKNQLIGVLQKRFSLNPEISIGTTSDKNVMVQTFSWLCRHFREFKPEYFDYIAIDEAHHAVAPSLEKAIRHFKPWYLLGMTATDKRLDNKKLESVFGDYETNLSLFEAIKNKLLAPISAFRVHTNIDLSEIRFNGRDYVNSDLQKTVFVPSRDQIIVDVLEKYFGNSVMSFKSGLIFCVSIQHARSMAARLIKSGFTAAAVSGKESHSEEYIAKYEAGEIQFLTTCSLLTEGWDCPRTSIVVMARPTMSKVLYTQQIGRGTRLCEGKKSLYVIDVVDNYGFVGPIKNTPWSIHSLLGISSYMAWANILDPGSKADTEEQILIQLYEQERNIEEIDIFTFEQKYPNHVSEEQLARELFVSTGTVSKWAKTGRIKPDIVIPFGRKTLNYYDPVKIDGIREHLNLAKHDETTIYDDFFSFLEERDYSMSYKIIMLLSFLKIADSSGECCLTELVGEYKQFYQGRIENKLQVDRITCPYDSEYLSDSEKIQISLLQNPFEKFERKRFMYYCKDLNYVSFSTVLWNQINNAIDVGRIRTQLFQDLQKYYESLGGIPNIDWYKDYWNIPDDTSEQKTQVEMLDNPPEQLRFVEYLPYYDLEAAAGAFELSRHINEANYSTWVHIKDMRLSDDMFVIRIKGHSMEPRIPDGSLAVFRGGSALGGSRSGRIVLVQSDDISCVETGWNLVVKRYRSEKDYDEFGNFKHQKIILESLNPDFAPIVLIGSEEVDFRVLGEFVNTLN